MPQSKLHSKSDRVSLISAAGGFDLPPHLVWGALALIVAATFVAYWPALGGALIWNDSDYVTKPELRSVQGLGRIWFDVGATEQYYPFLHSFFWIQCQLWGDQPLRLPLGEPGVACHRGVLVVSDPPSAKDSWSAAGGGHLRAASGHGRDGCLDHRTKEHAFDGAFI